MRISGCVGKVQNFCKECDLDVRPEECKKFRKKHGYIKFRLRLEFD